MRTIKFRGKDIVTGEWVVGNLFQGKRQGEDYAVILMDKRYVHEEKLPEDIPFGFYKDEIAVVKRETVGHFTGLCDCYARTIYEGDILMFRDEEDCNDTLVVMWDKGSFAAEYPNRREGECIRSNYFPVHPEIFRVVGNIHDNPELPERGL